MGEAAGSAQAVDLDHFNPFDPAVQQCPHPHYRAMQQAGAVFPVEGTDLYLVTRHELIVPILRDPRTFSNRFGNTGEPPSGPVVERLREVMRRGWEQVPTMLTMDPPAQTRYRGTVAPYFTPKSIAALRDPVVAIVERLIDGWIGAGEIELVADFAVPLPVEVIAHVLNVPLDRMADFKRWSDDSIAAIGARISDDRRVEAQEGIVAFQQYFAEQLEQRRACPQGDLLSDLVQAEIDTDEGGRRPLDMAEMLSIVQQLLVAGNETTTKALTEGVRLLAEHPEQWEALRADPAGRAPLVVEEVLRLSTPTQGMFRLVTEDTEIDGVPVPKGARSGARLLGRQPGSGGVGRRPGPLRPGSSQPQGPPRLRQGHPLLHRRAALPAGAAGGHRGAGPAAAHRPPHQARHPRVPPELRAPRPHPARCGVHGGAVASVA